MAQYNFQQDLTVAQETEILASKLLESKYGWKTERIGKDNKYDLLLIKDKRKITVEIKEDFISELTGNIAIEFSCRGKDSGIQTSKALYWLYIVHTGFGSEYIWISTKKLKALIELKMYKKVVSGGDVGSDSMNYLFDKKLIIKNGHLLFTLES